MAKIFKAPSSLVRPEFNWKDRDKYFEDCDKYKEDLKTLLLKRNPSGKNVGEIISFPVADSYAEYMVASMKPVELIHIDLGDGYDFQYVHKLNAKDIQEKIDQKNALNKIFIRDITREEYEKAVEIVKQYHREQRRIERNKLKPEPVPEDQWDVHKAHCCIDHGCKYGSAGCPVVLELVIQDSPCESCEDDEFHLI